MVDDDMARLRAHVDRVDRSGSRRLPSESRLSEAVGVSRARLRTLLKRLEAEGLIWRHVGKGTFVGPRQLAADDRGWAEAVSVDAFFDARIVIEPQLAARAAVHATSADMVTMDACLMEMEQAATFVHWKRLDEKLHRMVAAATHNVLLLLLMLYDTMRMQVKQGIEVRVEEIYGAVAELRRAADMEHRALVEATKTHNPAVAEERMRGHLRSVREAIFGLR